ncbi:MAG: hypothetical protein Homavirus3_13 [Homavirus sp.]|uniref:Uncharacterized protein n=1 Tax=Homavirus sp. TaxID=2487769 RepID=A0A3G5A477_9VIRU|nr:MAG: hypothetical protein Homavirus3_13 [Homavirus sp.]
MSFHYTLYLAPGFDQKLDQILKTYTKWSWIGSQSLVMMKFGYDIIFGKSLVNSLGNLTMNSLKALFVATFVTTAFAVNLEEYQISNIRYVPPQSIL